MSTNPFAALPLIKDDLKELSKKLLEFPPCNSWIHESVVAQYVGLPINNQHGQSEVLTALIACINKGFGGNKKKKTQVFTGFDPIELQNKNNGYGICFQIWGAKEPFKRGKDATAPLFREPRWFKFGSVDIHDLGAQMDIVNELAGNRAPHLLNEDDPSIPVYAAKRRKKSYIKFYKGIENECIAYRNYDVPAVAAKYLWFWPQIKLKSDTIRRRSFSPQDLLLIEEADFRLMIVSSNILGAGGKLVLDGNSVCPAQSTREARVPVSVRTSPSPASTVMHVMTPSRSRTRDESQGADPISSTIGSLPESLGLQGLKCTEDGVILWDMVSELGSLELMFRLIITDGLTLDAVETKMKSKRVDMPLTFEWEELCLLSKRSIMNARKNIKTARDDLMNHMGGHFVPKQDELLYEWLRDGKGYSEGRRVEANNFTMNIDSRARQLSIQASWMIRHILLSFNLPAVTVAALWACFYSLIMHREIPLANFISSTTVWNNTMRLQHIDKQVATNIFWKAIGRKTKHGFQRFFFSSSDDSKHFKLNRHVLIISTFDGGNESYDWCSSPTDPTFRHVCSSPPMVKSSNAQKNADEIIQLLGLENASYYLGGCNDNASDAQNEILMTHTIIMKALEDSNDDNLNSSIYTNGVRRRPIVFGDPFHWANLAVMYASKGMAGDTINGEHEQIHHRQCLMSMHSMHSDDPSYSQALMDRVVEGKPKVKISTYKERQQRWLVNQRYARLVLAMLACSTSGGVACLIAWALYFANKSRSGWKSRVGREVATWLSMPSIILGIHFESELGNYFEEAYAWHNRTGPHHTRSGFRMMEIHDLYFDFELPWWSEVNDEPSNHMPKTMAYLNENFDGEELEMQQTLIKRGLKAGRDELIKITKRYLLKVPILLLVLCNRKRGAPFLRAVLSVLHEYVENNISTEEPIDVMFMHDADTANSDDPKWGKYIYADPNDRPEDEKIWYDLLTKSKENIDDLVHFWQQLCLNWRVLTDDLQRLSKITSVSDMAGGEGLC